ncbi:MAG: hypothetical protein GX649_01145 [Chloroflexi bacterium]|nr:hypothetical protein [Chloroflexota bacterium]
MMTRMEHLVAARRGLLLGVLAVFLLLPSAVWIAQDRQAWPWDPAWYGEVSVELYYHLVHDSAWWPRLMGSAFGQKPPGIAWFGQAFVPLGQALGSVDDGLLASILVTQALTLVLVGRAILALTRSAGIAAAVVVGVAAGPLFIGLSHQYFAEPLQALSVAWFVLVAARAPHWGRARILSHLLAATVLAMLAKASSPLYCLGPGLVGLAYAWRPGAGAERASWREPTVAMPLAAGLVAGLATTGWYVMNWGHVTGHVALSSSGPIAEMFGWYDTLWGSYAYWLRAAQKALFLPEVLAVLGILLLGAVALRIVRRRRGGEGWDHPTLLAIVAVLQILGALAVFATSPNRENRFLLPLVPHVGVLLAWALLQVRLRPVTLLCVALFLYQGGVTYGQALGVLPRSAQATPWLIPAHRDDADDAMMNAIISRTCSTEADVWRNNVVGVDLAWLNHNTLTYYAAKRRLGEGVTCGYRPLGFAEADPERAWTDLLALNPRYLITAAPSHFPDPEDPFNRVSGAILERAREAEFAGPEEIAGSAGRVHLYVRREE